MNNNSQYYEQQNVDNTYTDILYIKGENESVHEQEEIKD